MRQPCNRVGSRGTIGAFDAHPWQGSGAFADSTPAGAATRVAEQTGSSGPHKTASAVHCALAAPNPTMGLCALLASGLHLRSQAILEDQVMDAHRFDRLTRSLTQTGSRRALATALAGSLGLLGFARPDETVAGGKCKPKCSECQTCKKGKRGKKGKCKAKAEGTGCSAGSCQSGQCVAAAVPVPPPFCQGQPDGTECDVGKKCGGGVCATPPGCSSFGAGCTGDPACCSARCSCADGDGDGNCDGASGTCNPGVNGKPCNNDRDCTSAHCVGFVCRVA